MYYKKDIIGKKIRIRDLNLDSEIKEIFIDLNKKIISGYEVKCHLKFKRKFISTDGLTIIDGNIFSNNFSEKRGVSLSQILGLDIFDKVGCLKGDAKDIIVDKDYKSIRGLISNEGIVNKILYGYKIYLINDIEFEKDKITCCVNKTVCMNSIFHGIGC